MDRSKGGKVIYAQVFDTYKTSEEFEIFLLYDEVPDGAIVIAACKDECWTSFSDTCKQWFENMGSKEIFKL